MVGGSLAQFDMHATCTAGLAAGAGNNGIGTTGVAFRSTILPVRVFEGQTSASLAGFISAIYYAGMPADVALNFHRFYGDANGDARIDVADFGLFSNSYGTSSGQTGYLGYFDFNGDNRIDIVDFGQFSLRYFTNLP